jgi:CheY-like chemotaxis protein
MKKVLFVDDAFVFHLLWVQDLDKKVVPVSTMGDPSALATIIQKTEPDEVLMDVEAASNKGLDIMKAASRTCHDVPFRICAAPCRGLLKSLLSCEDDRSQRASKKTVGSKVDRGA